MGLWPLFQPLPSLTSLPLGPLLPSLLVSTKGIQGDLLEASIIRNIIGKVFKQESTDTRNANYFKKHAATV